MATSAEEEAIIKQRYLTSTVATAANTLPPFKRLVKKCAARGAGRVRGCCAGCEPGAAPLERAA